MRLILAAALAFVPVAFAQHNPSGSYGNVLHPGVPSPGALRAPAPISRMGGGGRFGGRHSFAGGAGYLPYQGYGLGYGYGLAYGPSYSFDGFYATDSPAPYYGPGPGNDPSAAYPPTPTVIINQNFQTDSVHPQLRDYSNTPLPQPGTVMVPPAAPVPSAPPLAPAAPSLAPQLADDQPTIFLIAMQDHTIVPVIAYWVAGGTLHYVTVDSVPNQVSLAEVDRDFSRKLNADRHVPFALPAPR